MNRNNTFSILLFALTILIILIISITSKYTSIITSYNRVEFGNLLLGAFILIIISLFVIELRALNINTFKKMSLGLLALSLTLLLVLSIFDMKTGIYGTAFFIFSTLIYVIIHGKVYSLNSIYLVVFAYPFLEFMGTIGTAKGFHFPEITYSFYLIPLAFSCFRLRKDTLLYILKLFIHILLIFIAFSIIFWYYNLIHSDVKFIDWITKKTFVNGVSAYKFVADWSRYCHPSYINLVLLPGLISILYLYYQKNEKAWISKSELFLYVIGCISFQLLSESRIGLVALALILLVTALYYLRLKAWNFKPILMFVLVCVSIGLFIGQNKVSSFLSDPVRKTDNALAINYIKSNPWWGIGFGNEHLVLIEQEKIVKKELILIHTDKTYVHNELLGTMIQFGIPGAVILLIFLVGLFWYAFKSRSYLLQLFMLLYFLFMLIEEPLYVQEGITRFMIFLAFFIHLSECDKPIKEYSLFNWFSKSKPT